MGKTYKPEHWAASTTTTTTTTTISTTANNNYAFKTTTTNSIQQQQQPQSLPARVRVIPALHERESRVLQGAQLIPSASGGEGKDGGRREWEGGGEGGKWRFDLEADDGVSPLPISLPRGGSFRLTWRTSCALFHPQKITPIDFIPAIPQSRESGEGEGLIPRLTSDGEKAAYSSGESERDTNNIMSIHLHYKTRKMLWPSSSPSFLPSSSYHYFLLPTFIIIIIIIVIIIMNHKVRYKHITGQTESKYKYLYISTKLMYLLTLGLGVKNLLNTCM